MSYVTVRMEPYSAPIKLSFAYGFELIGADGLRFKLGQAIKSGGNGIVFEATCLSPDGHDEGLCAVKLLRELSDVRQDRFDNEVRILTALNHPNITRVFGYGRQALGDQQIEVPWMAMTLGDKNLRQYLDSHKAPLDMPTVAGVGIQLCDAVGHCHANGIIHRDLKPANLVWATEDDRDNIFLIDFGIAKYVSEDVSGRKMDDLTSLHEFIGPANFASPELLAYARDKSHQVGSHSDLFQIGLIVWFLATNQIVAGIPSRRADPTGGALYEIVTSLLAMDPRDRLQTASETAEALKAMLGA
ncbi:serine/threonine-protein kinase [Lacipirellula sp.]|uniref:serine/threonine-protein kinase n=1 Tax=Lacipirellula sp. TaxID=2691419 RepID=UPI003D0D4301